MHRSHREKIALQKVRDAIAAVMTQRGTELPGLCVAADHGNRAEQIDLRFWRVVDGHRYSMTYLMSGLALAAFHEALLHQSIEYLFDQFKAGPQ